MAVPPIRIDRFLGEAPKIASELLPESAAGYAYNVKLYSGNLIPFNKTSVATTLAKSGVIKSIYPLNDGVGGYKWLHWTSDVDVARAPIQNDTTQRVYFTGDGEPKVTNYALATTGAGTAYPYASYTLGFPAPLTAPTAAAVGFSQLTAATRKRDSGNTATIKFAADHGLLNGTYVTATNFGGTGYNLTNAQITVIDSLRISFYSPGLAEAEVADTAGKIDLSGFTKSRTYVYTWYDEWGQESVPSPVSSTLYLKDGQTVNITDLPAAWPGSYTGTYLTANMKCRLYRTITSTSGTLYYKVADIALGTTSYTDTVQDNTLSTALPSTYYDQPDAQMIGLRSIHNNIMVGFFGNTVCFSEPGQPHAWPIKYRQHVDAEVVAVATVGQMIIVLTEKNPWVIQGSTPAVMSKTRMDYTLTCTAKRGVVNMGYGVVFPTPGGLALYAMGVGGDLLTKNVLEWDTWDEVADSDSLVAGQYNGRYFATSDKGSFAFERDEKTGGFLVRITQRASAMYYDQHGALLYYVDGSSLTLWDDPAQGFGEFDWKSKTFVLPEPGNYGAARVLADYGANPNDAIIAAQNTAQAALNAGYISGNNTKGPIARSAFGSRTFSGSQLKAMQPLGTAVQFQLYIDKELIFTTQLANDLVFRLPSGYKSDTVEVRLSGNARVRAIHLAETPTALRRV